MKTEIILEQPEIQRILSGESITLTFADGQRVILKAEQPLSAEKDGRRQTADRRKRTAESRMPAASSHRSKTNSLSGSAGEFKCHHCKDRFETLRGRSMHITKTHSTIGRLRKTSQPTLDDQDPNRPFRCAEHGVSYRTQAWLNNHMEREHRKAGDL